ncbi:MAG TPA: hypothetical protein VGE08_10035 [Steroidobacter sp.]|uniref:hypothetical protein n=1 Tax=Steroidobacter sp. TaxID=1978227 RepID=UPI002ED98393
MSGPRIYRRLSASKIAAVVIQVRGEKAIKDSDLAALFGISRSALYAKLSGKLWRFKPTVVHKLSKAHDRGRQDVRPTLAFTQAGVLLVAGILADDTSLEIGMEIAHALKTRRRSSLHKKRPARRAKDPKKAASYAGAKSRLAAARLRGVRGRVLH